MYASRWKGKTPQEVSAAMRALALRRVSKLSPAQLTERAHKMLAGRRAKRATIARGASK